MGMKEKVLIIVALVLVCAALAVPVWQAAWNRELTIRLESIERNVSEIEEQQRLIKGRIAQFSLPEWILEKAREYGLPLEKIQFDHVKVVWLEDQP